MSQLKKVAKEQQSLKAQSGDEVESRLKDFETRIGNMLADQSDALVNQLSGGTKKGGRSMFRGKAT